MSVEYIPAEEVKRMVESGAIRDAKTVVAVLSL